jgi:hypothetical protein
MKGFLFTSAALIAMSAVAGVQVSKEPSDSEMTACVENAIKNVGGDPLECIQRVVVTGVCDVPMPAPITDNVVETVTGANLVWSGEPSPTYVPKPIEDPSLPAVVDVIHTFTFVGELNENAAQSIMSPGKYPNCWGWEFKPLEPFVHQLRPPTVPDYVPPVEPGGMDGNGLTGDGTWRIN